MFNVTRKYSLKVIHNSVYVVLLLIGCYFIYNGHVVDRFQQRRTNFAEYHEHIIELPAITAWMEYSLSRKAKPRNLLFGKDFNVYMSKLSSLVENSSLKQKNQLSLGKNNISGLTLQLHVQDTWEDWGGGQLLRLYPSDFSQGSQHDFVISFKFETHANLESSRAAIALSSTNNSYCGFGFSGTDFDGEITDVHAKAGEIKWMKIKPEKYIFIKDNEKCRDEPYNDIFVKRVEQLMIEKCPAVCRHADFWICNPKLKDVLPICKDDKTKKCFDEIFKLVKPGVTIKPCTKLQYHFKEASYYQTPFDQIDFVVQFVPAMVVVKEEYLIFDMIAMISSIGGTLGLCIGFSFREIAGLMLKYLEVVFLDNIKQTFNTKLTRI